MYFIGHMAKKLFAVRRKKKNTTKKHTPAKAHLRRVPSPEHTANLKHVSRKRLTGEADPRVGRPPAAASPTQIADASDLIS